MMSDKFTAHGTFQLDAENQAVWDAWMAAGDEHSERERLRCLEASRLSGLEVVYDLSVWDDLWSPIFLWPNEQPVGWVDVASGRRVNSSEYPTEPLR